MVFDPPVTSLDAMLRIFWENHNPTQGMRQGNDVGTQYRSGIYVVDDVQRLAAERSREQYAGVLAAAGHGPITTEIVPAPPFYYAEDYHQQYLAKKPLGLLRHRRHRDGSAHRGAGAALRWRSCPRRGGGRQVSGARRAGSGAAGSR